MKTITSIWKIPSHLYASAAECLFEHSAKPSNAEHALGCCWALDCASDLPWDAFDAFRIMALVDDGSAVSPHGYTITREAWGPYNLAENSEPRVLWLLFMSHLVADLHAKPKRRVKRRVVVKK